MNKKIIANAVSAYFWLWALLLIPSKKENINHPFVKKHARTAVFIHLLMLTNYLIFITYSFLGGIIINSFWFSFWLNHIFASIIFLWLFGWLLYWVSKANSWNDFSIKDMASMSKTDKIIEVKNSNLNEQWILTIILSLIPFVWFIIRWKFLHYKSPIIENNVKLNLIITFVISLMFVFENKNIALLFILAYTIFIVFYSVLVITRQNLIIINLEKIKTIQEIYIFSRSLIKYLKNYFSSKQFLSLNELIESEKKFLAEIDKNDKDVLTKLNENKLPKYIAYIPYLNLISLIDINSKNRFHIINWLILTVLSIWLFFTWYNNYQLLILMPIFFWIWYTKIIEYKLPFLFNIYKMFAFIFSKIFSGWKKLKEKQKEVQEIVFKVWE